MKAIIEIRGLKIQACHGVLPQERMVGNTFQIDLALEYPSAVKATETDCVDDTLNYATVIEIIKRVMSEPSYLIEHVARRILHALTTEFPDISGGRITVAKLAPPVSAELTSAAFTLIF